jgi:hypothetical protein
VTIRSLQVRPSVDEMAKYADVGDLEIVQRVEVKRRLDIDFDDRESFPFPTVIVDVAHTWDKARPKPFAYLIFNASMTCCCIVMGTTSLHWQRVEKSDRAKKRTRTFYECPVQYCHFVRTD